MPFIQAFSLAVLGLHLTTHCHRHPGSSGLLASANNNCPLLSTVLSIAQAAGQSLAIASSRNSTLICLVCSIPCRDYRSILNVPVTGFKTLARGWECGFALECLPSVHKTLGSASSTGNKHHHHPTEKKAVPCASCFLLSISAQACLLLITGNMFFLFMVVLGRLWTMNSLYIPVEKQSHNCMPLKPCWLMDSERLGWLAFMGCDGYYC